jgi:hypothetical protein
MGSVVDRGALGQVFSEYFGFPCHSFIPLIAAHLSSRAGTSGQQMLSVIVDLVPVRSSPVAQITKDLTCDMYVGLPVATQHFASVGCIIVM